MSTSVDESHPTVHASCVLVGTLGVLVRGVSGSGKSSLCDTLVEAAWSKRHFAAHVADDRTQLLRRKTVLVARPAPSLAGKLEIRGLGITGVAHENEAAVRLVVDLVPIEDVERLPPEPLTSVLIEEVNLPTLVVAQNDPQEALRRIRHILRKLFPKAADYI